MYRIVLTRRALKDIDTIDRETKRRIAVKLKEYSKDPLKHGRKLVNPKIGSYRFRIGDHRVIFDLEGSDILVLRVGHRKEVYK